MKTDSPALAAMRNTLNKLYAWRDHHEATAAQITAAKDRSRTAADDLLWHASNRDRLSTVIAEMVAIVKLMEA